MIFKNIFDLLISSSANDKSYDMALISYELPVLGLSYFMYSNTDRQTRDDHWYELLDVYWSLWLVTLCTRPQSIDAKMRKHA